MRWHLRFRNAGNMSAISDIASIKMLNLSVLFVDFQMKVRYNESFLLFLHRNLDKKCKYGKTY